MILDKETREAIQSAVRKAQMDVNEVYHEKWLTGKELCKEVGLFTEKWIKTYGHTLPRERVCVTTAEGVTHRTGWCYPKMKIMRMIHEGELRNLMG